MWFLRKTIFMSSLTLRVKEHRGWDPLVPSYSSTVDTPRDSNIMEFL